MTIDKLLKKYRDRLLVLNDNKGLGLNLNNYPYDLDIITTKEIIKDLEKLDQSPIQGESDG